MSYKLKVSFSNDERDYAVYDGEDIERVPIAEIFQKMGCDLKRVSRGEYVTRIRPEDDNPSCYVNVNKNCWNDFGGSGGGVVQAVMAIDPIRYPDWRSAATYIVQNFDVPPINNDLSGVKMMSNYEFELIGIQPDRASKNIDWDLECFTISQAQKLADRLGDQTMQALAINDRSMYVSILRHTAVPYVIKQHHFYRNHLLNLMKWKEGSIEYKLIYDSLKEHLAEYRKCYNALKRALTKEEAKVAYYNVGETLDEEIRNYKAGKFSIECGNRPYSELKAEAKDLKKSTYKFEDLTIENYEGLLENGTVSFAAFARQGKYSIVVEASDVKRTAEILGVAVGNFTEAQTNSIAKNNGGLTEFGVWAKKRLLDMNVKESELAEGLEIDQRRISEAFRGKNAKVEAQLKEALDYHEPQIHSTEVMTPEQLAKQHGLRYFSQLNDNEQKIIVDRLYNSPANKSRYDPSLKAKTKDEIIKRLIDKGFMYDEKLACKRNIKISENQAGTVDFYQLKASSTNLPYYTKEISRDVAEELRTELFKNNAPFSSVNKATGNVKFTFRSQDMEQIRSIADKCGLQFTEDHSIRYTKERIKQMQMAAMQQQQATVTAGATVNV